MTTVDRSRADARAHRARGRRVAMHVVETWDAGVRAAILQFVHATPEVEHHLLRTTARSEFSRDGESAFASVRGLPTGFWAAGRAVRGAARDIRPDVVHAHSWSAGVVVRSAIRSRPRRRIAYSPHCFEFERLDLSTRRRAFARIVERLLAANTDTFAACSPGEARTAAGMHVRRVVAVPNVARIPALAMMERRHPTRIVAAGRIGTQKDPDFYRRTVELLGVDRPEMSAWWIGDGTDVAARYRLEKDGIHVTGWLSDFEANRALGAGGVYLHTARWEGFPLPILEAVELGIPVLAREVPTLRGAVATPGLATPEAMADAAATLLDGGEEARQANLDSWRTLLAHNTAERQAAALRVVYATGSAAPLLVNGTWLGSSSPSALQRYATEVTRRLIDTDPSVRIVVPRDAVVPEWLPGVRVLRSRLRGVAFEQAALPWRARRSILLTLAGPAPLLTRAQLVVMHDATAERFPSALALRLAPWHRLMRRVLASRARHLVTVSEFSRDELADVLGVEAGRFAVAPNGREHATADETAGVSVGAEVEVEPLTFDAALIVRIADPFVICLSDPAGMDHLAPLARALSDAQISVVIVGAEGAPQVVVAESGLDLPGVHLAGRLSDAQLVHLFRHARALVVPSLSAGLGLSIVEAQALACPVIASDHAAIHEAAGSGAVYFDATRPEDAVEILARLDPATRERIVADGLRNVARYSWDRAAATILALATDAAVVPAAMALLESQVSLDWPPPEPR